MSKIARSIQFPDAMRLEIERLAQENGLPFAAQVRLIVAAWLREQKRG